MVGIESLHGAAYLEAWELCYYGPKFTRDFSCGPIPLTIPVLSQLTPDLQQLL